MQIIFHKSLSRLLLVSIFGEQSGICYFCNRKVTEKNLAAMFKNKAGESKVCCKGLPCLIDYVQFTGAKNANV